MKAKWLSIVGVERQTLKISAEISGCFQALARVHLFVIGHGIEFIVLLLRDEVCYCSFYRKAQNVLFTFLEHFIDCAGERVEIVLCDRAERGINCSDAIPIVKPGEKEQRYCAEDEVGEKGFRPHLLSNAFSAEFVQQWRECFDDLLVGYAVAGD